MSFPLYQPEFGYELPRTHVSDVDLPYYTFVKLGDVNGNNKDTKITLAGPGDIPIGVVIPEVGDDFMVVSDPNGYGDGIMPRTGYKAGQDYPRVVIFGDVLVKVAVGASVIAGQSGVVGVGGLANVFVAPTVSATPTGAQVTAYSDAKNTIAGTFIDSGTAGQYVRIFMKMR